MTCVVEQRDRLRRAAEALGQLANVAATEVRAPDVTPSDSFELEIVLGKAVVGPLLLDVLSARRLHVVDVSRRDDPTHCIVRVRP